MSNQFLALITVHNTGRQVAVNDRPGDIRIMRVNDYDSIWREIEQRSKQGFASCQCRLRLLTTRDVAQDKKTSPLWTFHVNRNRRHRVETAQPEKSIYTLC